MAGIPKRAALAFSTILLIACGGAPDADEAADVDSAALAPAPAPGPSLADYAGTWNVVVMNEAGDSVAGYRLDATADMNGWTMSLPDRQPIPVRIIAMEGDSVVTQAGPFESVLRPGTQVTTDGVVRLQGGMLVGTTVAHYPTTGADSVARLTTRGTRAN